MRLLPSFIKANFWSVVFIMGFQISAASSFAQQQLDIRDFTIFADGTVQIGSSNSINGGAVGSYTLVQTTGNAEIKSDIHSGGKISLVNSNVAGVAGGKITAANSANLSGTVISVGSSATINGDVYSRGPMVVGGGTVSGAVTVFPGTYTGPTPTGGLSYDPFTPPTLPDLPAITDLSGYPTVTTNITSNFNNGPGNYGNINFSGNKTLTLNAPGVYVFNSIKMSGNSNKLVFSNTPGNYTVYVKGNADFGKLSSSGGDPSRIFFEVQGNGATALIPNYSFIIANGSSGSASKWLGSVWAPNGGINIGSGTGSSTLTGSLYSSKQVNIQSGVAVFYAPFTVCDPPNASAGLVDSIPLDFSPQTRLIGTSTTPGVTYSWQATNGGIITSPANNDTIYVSVSGTYILTVSSASNCFTRDTVVVTSRLKSIIGSELQSIYDNRPTSSPFFILSPDSVMIDVIVKDGKYSEVLSLLQTPAYGLRSIISNGTSNLIITGKFPIANLPKLNLLSALINFCRTYYQAVNYLDSKISNDNPVVTGLVTSAGDIAMRTNLVRKGYNLNGDGVKVGVVSDSYTNIRESNTPSPPFYPIPGPIPQSFITQTAPKDISAGDLPGDTTFSWANPQHVVNPNGFNKNVHVIQDFPSGLSDEGRAMLQIVHDVAPGAELYFRTGFFTANDCALGIKQLTSAGCDIIVDDITYITEPFFKAGVIAQAVNEVNNQGQGVAYFTSAGNFANKSYAKNFNPVTIPGGPFAGKKAHNFGNNDMFQKVKLAPGDYTIVFQWADDIYSFGELLGTRFDIDGYLTPNTDGTSLFGYNRDNTGGDPIEFIPFTIPGTDSVDANIFIVNNTTTGDPAGIKYVVYRGGIKIVEYNNEGNSTITGQANATGAITVGAARFDKVRPYVNTPLIESFSSVGRSQINGIGGKPDLVGPDGVNTTVHLGQDYPNTALDGYSNFFGTSAAAPHAAAAAALLIEGRKKFLVSGLTTTPTQIRSLMQSTAIDMGSPGFDSLSGSGFVNIDLAMRTFAAPRPSIDLLKFPFPAGPVPIRPGDVQDTLLVLGQNFSTNSKIYFNDSAIDATHYISTDSLFAVIPKFEGNPPVKVCTPPYPTTNGLDGGCSNNKYFFTAAIAVKADTLTKKYSQDNPPLTAVISITDNNNLVQNISLRLDSIGKANLDAATLEKLDSIGLKNMTLVTDATRYSDVGTSKIIFKDNIPPDSLFKTYSYKFTEATLSIQKMPVTVTPADATITFGQYAGNITFNYAFTNGNPANPDSVRKLLKIFHQAYVPNNALAVIKTNGSVFDTSLLRNLNMMASFKGVKNSRKFVLDNVNELVPISDQTTFNVKYLVDVASESVFNYKINPNQAQFFNAYPGLTSKAILGAAALNSDNANVEVNGSLVKIVNGSLEQMVNTSTGPMVPVLNGEFVQIINGTLVKIVNGEIVPIEDGSLVQLLANGSLVKIVNGEFVPIANGSLVKLVNGSLVKIVNGSLVQLVDGVETPIITNVTDITSIPNGSLVKIVNGSLVKMVNGSLVKIVNGSTEQILNGSLVKIVNGSLVKIVNGTTLGLGTSNTNNNTAVIIDQTDVDPLQANWLGAMFGINMITGLEVGTQWLVPGVLVNSNFDVSYRLGKVTINSNPCLITHSLDKNFGSSANPGTTTSLWLNVVTKISGQLKSKGDYLLFKSGAITFNNISSTPTVTNLPLPTGKIIADSISAPFTKYDAASNIWTTKVPIGFSSTSDIFVSGVIINSSTGFVKNNNASTSLKGMFYSNRTFKDQWAYASAAYQPQFTYSSIADSGQVISINGNYKAGTPTTQINNLVNGGSGGGGNNYTGSTNSYDKYTACISAGTSLNRPYAVSPENISDDVSQEEFKIIPNPATNYINLSFVPGTTGNFKIGLFTIDGKKISETYNGICEAGIQYRKKIDVSKLASGIYLIQLRSTDKVFNKKIVIVR